MMSNSRSARRMAGTTLLTGRCQHAATILGAGQCGTNEMAQEDQPWLGGLLIIVSAMAYSLAGFFTRLIPLDAWTLLFWRGIYGGLFIGGAIVWLHGRDT